MQREKASNPPPSFVAQQLALGDSSMDSTSWRGEGEGQPLALVLLSPEQGP